jgi:hypothetical protein
VASIFDSVWDRAAATMDAAVDRILGDRISYALDGKKFELLEGFVIDENARSGMDEIDEPVSTRKRVKIAKALVPAPSMTHRIRHPRLGPGTYQPLGSQPETEGRYWLFDVQEV